MADTVDTRHIQSIHDLYVGHEGNAEITYTTSKRMAVVRLDALLDAVPVLCGEVDRLAQKVRELETQIERHVCAVPPAHVNIVSDSWYRKDL